MLLGTYHSRLTQKGQVALPAKFKAQTGSKLVVARWYEDCLVIVALNKWQEFLSRLARQEDVVTKPIRSVERFILATAFEVATDDQGRFVIPPILREMVNLNEKVVFLGLGERIELWDQITWEKEEKRVKREADQMLEQIARERKK